VRERSREVSYVEPVGARIPRRPEVPGVPGLRLPHVEFFDEATGPADYRDGLTSTSSVREVSSLLRGTEDDEPTNPSIRVPVRSLASAPPPHARYLDSEESDQLDGIIRVWEAADGSARALLAEFARQLPVPARK
jgi:hypothetical protein